MAGTLRTHQDYHIGIICALAVERAAVEAMLDDRHTKLEKIDGDENDYALGRIWAHNVVIACLPAGSLGNGPAAIVAKDMTRSFPLIKFGLMVGIGGGVYSEIADIRLGDVVVSQPYGKHGGGVHWDFGKIERCGEFQCTKGNKLQEALLEIPPLMAEEYKYQGADQDQLFEATYDHEGDKICNQCDPEKVVFRPSRTDSAPRIHYGNVASGNAVMKHGVTRDRVAEEEGIICFEMEAAGLTDSFPCLVIRGICDYADSHKNKIWQPYAAATAAAVARELLDVVDNQEVGHTFHCSRPEEVKACLKALFLTDPVDDRDTLRQVKGSRVEGTCGWIKANELYKSWCQSHSQLLWLSGGPGKGKTMLSIFLAEELERFAKASQDVVFLQYFCDNKDEKRNTAVAILRGLIWQLLKCRPQLSNHILPSFRDRDSSQLVTSFNSLWRVFETMILDPALGTAYSVLDGLDECDKASLEFLLQKINALFSKKSNSSPACRLNLIAVSRDLPDFIPDLLSSFPRIRLDPDADTEINDDICRFIEIKVEDLSVRKHYSERLHQHVREVFLDRAKGTFLWVGIVAHELRNKNPPEVEAALNEFPSGLEALYTRMLLQISRSHRENAAKILRWVVMAVRPLTLSELSEAIELTFTASTGSNRDEAIKDQVAYCGYFLTIKQQKVNLIHQSAKDYLLGKDPNPDKDLEFFRIDEEQVNSEIEGRCLAYLQNGSLAPGPVPMWKTRKDDQIDNTTRLKAFPLLSYAIVQWPEHARSLTRLGDIFDLSQPFYHRKSLVRHYWLQSYWDKRGISSLGQALFGDFSFRHFPLLHLASYFGLFILAKNVLREGKWTTKLGENIMDKSDEAGFTALQWAADQGHEKIVRLLLEKRADILNKREIGHMHCVMRLIEGMKQWCSCCSRKEQMSI